MYICMYIYMANISEREMVCNTDDKKVTKLKRFKPSS